MQAATKGVYYIIAFTLFMYGVIDIVGQIKAGDEIRWGVPVFFLCIGTGIPSAMFFFSNSGDNESGECGSEESSDYSSGDYGGSEGGGD